MITFDNRWKLIEITSTGNYIYESPTLNYNPRSGIIDFSLLKKMYHNYIGEEYPTIKINFKFSSRIFTHKYIVESSCSYKEMSDKINKQLKELLKYHNDSRIQRDMILGLLQILSTGTIFLDVCS